jgi:hypothetical protein
MMDEPIEQYKAVEKLELKELKKELSQKFKKINCPSCDDEIASNAINLQNSIAKCSNCNVIFSIEEDIENIKAKNEIKQQILRPEGIDLFYYGDELDITIDQHIEGFNAWAIAFAPFIAIGAVLLFFLGKNPISPYFPISFSLVAFYYLYKAFTYSKNKIYIDINNRYLSIKYRPENFKKDKMYAADEIDQLYLKPSSDGLGHYTIHMIVNGLEGQKHEKLMTVKTLSKAKFLEQEIEKYLNISNREIPEAKI